MLATAEDYIEQHKHRLSYMPWLYWTLKSKHLEWAEPWQEAIQSRLSMLETVSIQGRCFIAPQAHIFAQRGRPITIAEGSYIAADCYVHGPIQIGKNVSINHHACLDGGRKGIHIGDHTRIAAYCSMYAFNHSVDTERNIHEQAVSSKGIHIGRDVWLGANSGIVDGVEIADGAIVGMHSVVTNKIEQNNIVAGQPARLIKVRK